MLTVRDAVRDWIKLGLKYRLGCDPASFQYPFALPADQVTSSLSRLATAENLALIRRLEYQSGCFREQPMENN